jgi:hypothetical protein
MNWSIHPIRSVFERKTVVHNLNANHMIPSFCPRWRSKPKNGSKDAYNAATLDAELGMGLQFLRQIML